jgi:hypothetical protein
MYMFFNERIEIFPTDITFDVKDYNWLIINKDTGSHSPRVTRLFER